MSKLTLRWAAYTRNQEAVAAAIARKEYVDLTPTGAGVVDDTVFSMDGTELPATERYPEAGQVTSTREVKDKWGRVKTVSSTRYGYLLLSLRGVDANTVAAARVDKIGTPEHPWVLALVQAAKLSGARVKALLVDGAYCVGSVLWELKHEEQVDFILPADSSMCITQDARGLARLKEGAIIRENHQIRAVGVKGLTTYQAYQPPQNECHRRGPKATLNAVVVTRWNGREVPEEEQKVLLTSLSVDDPLAIVELYRKRAQMENKLHRELKQGSP